MEGEEQPKSQHYIYKIYGFKLENLIPRYQKNTRPREKQTKTREKGKKKARKRELSS